MTAGILRRNARFTSPTVQQRVLRDFMGGNKTAAAAAAELSAGKRASDWSSRTRNETGKNHRPAWRARGVHSAWKRNRTAPPRRVKETRVRFSHSAHSCRRILLRIRICVRLCLSGRPPVGRRGVRLHLGFPTACDIIVSPIAPAFSIHIYARLSLSTHNR